MQKSHLILGTYNHLPEGADESLFEETYQVSWRPFLSVLYRFPDISATMNYSGTALRWLEARHPEFLMLMEEMVLRKQIELLGGGFFAPLLPLVPGADRLGQIELLTTYIRKAFGKRPRGCWVQDYAWEPGLASTLQTSGFDFAFLTERHFRLAGLGMHDLGTPVMTEDQGRSIAVFPVLDAQESFPAPLAPADAVEAARKRMGELPLYCILYSEAATRSLWSASKLESPDVMFERDFAALQKLSLELETTTPSRYLRSMRHFKRAYFPGNASSALMRVYRDGEESSKGGGESLEAGSLRRLLLWHEESLALYSKMHYVRILVGQLRGDKSRKKSAQEELWRGQCGDAYWCAPSGGIAQLSIRAAAYGALIEAEKTTRLRGSFAPGVIAADLDFDGVKEILYQGADLNAYVHLKGGCLTEFDSLRSRWNYVNAMGPGKDQARLLCFQDRCMRKGGFGSDVGGFSNAYYSLTESERPAHSARLAHEGWVEIGGKRRPLSLKKNYVFRKGSLSADYELENSSADKVSFRFVVEFNLTAGLSPAGVSLAQAHGRDVKSLDPSHICDASGSTSVRLENLRQSEQLEIRSETAFELRHEPIFAAATNAGGTTDAYQGCRLLLGWDVELAAAATGRFALTLELKA
ncbi:MAG TPA: alpha-amylase/4-alpha-glucanotransferase domain-containing protein [Rectinemataceae bacterium]|nr:alpha-amylase/4-alpha-glucanotransferase domain-containing protein [Rectinemataceae bacterium]